MATSARLDELKKKFDENPRRYFAPLANEYRKLGDISQAIALCRAHLPNQPGHISGHIVLAQALYEARELGEARSIFEAALDLDPENLIALRYLGDIAREQGEPSSARTWYERVLDADPRNDEIAALLKELELTESAPEPVAVAAPEIVATRAADLPFPPVEQPFRTNAMTGAFDALTEEPSVQPLPLEATVPGDRAEASDVAEVVELEVSRISDREAHDAPDVAPEAELAKTAVPPEEPSTVDPFFGAAPDAAVEIGELDVVVDASVDDWFGAPTEHPELAAAAASDPAAFDDSFFPDLAAATPVVSEAIPEPIALSFPTPTEVDVQAPTPPFVRAEESRTTIPTPAFLSAFESPEASEPAALVSSVDLADSGDQSPPPAGETRDAPVTAIDEEPAAVDVPPVFVSAYESEHARDTVESGDFVEGVAAVEAVDAAEAIDSQSAVEATSVDHAPATPESIDWHSAPTPVASPAIPVWGATESLTPLSTDAVESSSLEAMPMAEAEASPAPAEESLVDFSAWIAEAPTEAIEASAVSEVDAEVPDASVPEELMIAGADEKTIAEGELADTETLELEPDFAAFVAAPAPDEVTASAAPPDFILEEGGFDSSAAGEVPFIANRVSVPDEADDAYSVGAPELSAHEPFPLEAERENDLDLTASPLAGWGDAIDAAADSDESPSIVAPMEGLVSRETPADLAAIAGAALYDAHAAPGSEGEDDMTSVTSPSGTLEPFAALAGDANDAVQAEAVAAAEVAEASPVAGEPAAFVTETMAELYLQQGFHAEALSIYRQLLAQQPNDPVLSDRVAALERGAASAVVGGIAPRDTIDRAGQSVRSFFLHFARREPRRPASRGGEEDAESSEPHGAGALASDRTPSFSGVATREEALTVPDGPSESAGSAGGATTLSDLFAAGAVSGADERAASALASAFGGGESASSTAGGERELSLEHLFRDVPERSSAAVTLDEFYEGSSPGSSAPTSPGGEGGEERDADIEQFTAWLEGLKKK